MLFPLQLSCYHDHLHPNKAHVVVCNTRGDRFCLRCLGATLTSPDETSTTTQQLARISELERIAAAAQPGPVLTAALEVVGGAFKSEAVPEVCVEALLGVVAHLDVGHHGPSARSRRPRNPPGVVPRARRDRVVASASAALPRDRSTAARPQVTNLATNPSHGEVARRRGARLVAALATSSRSADAFSREPCAARALLGAVARLDGRDRAGAVVAREASAALEGILARGGSAAREAVFSWARGRGGAAWPALLDGGGPAAVAVARCLGALAAAAAREGDAALVDAFFDLAADERLLRAVKRGLVASDGAAGAATARLVAGLARLHPSLGEQLVVCGGGVVDHAWDGLRHAAAANATVEPFVGALRALAAAAPGDFYGGLRDHALDLLLDAVGPEALDGARYAPHPAGRSDGDVAALELVAGAAPSRGRGALARIAAVVAARLRLGAAGPARLAEWRVLAAVGAAAAPPLPGFADVLAGAAARPARDAAERAAALDGLGAALGAAAGDDARKLRAAVAALAATSTGDAAAAAALARAASAGLSDAPFRALLVARGLPAALLRASAGDASGAVAACYEALVGGAGGACAVAWFAGAVRAAPPELTPQRVAAGLLGDLGGQRWWRGDGGGARAAAALRGAAGAGAGAAAGAVGEDAWRRSVAATALEALERRGSALHALARDGVLAAPAAAAAALDLAAAAVGAHAPTPHALRAALAAALGDDVRPEGVLGAPALAALASLPGPAAAAAVARAADSADLPAAVAAPEVLEALVDALGRADATAALLRVCDAAAAATAPASAAAAARAAEALLRAAVAARAASDRARVLGALAATLARAAPTGGAAARQLDGDAVRFAGRCLHFELRRAAGDACAADASPAALVAALNVANAALARAAAGPAAAANAAAAARALGDANLGGVLAAADAAGDAALDVAALLFAALAARAGAGDALEVAAFAAARLDCTAESPRRALAAWAVRGAVEAAPDGVAWGGLALRLLEVAVSSRGGATEAAAAALRALLDGGAAPPPFAAFAAATLLKAGRLGPRVAAYAAALLDRGALAPFPAAAVAPLVAALERGGSRELRALAAAAVRAGAGDARLRAFADAPLVAAAAAPPAWRAYGAVLLPETLACF